MMIRTSGVLLVLALAASAVAAGVVLEVETTDLQGNPVRPADTLYAMDEMLRMEPGGEGAGGFTMILRDRTLYLVNDRDRTYHRMDEEAMQSMGSQMNEAMKKMEAQLANLPEQQRAMVEKMMKDRLPMAPEEPEREVKKEGTEKVDAFTCTRYAIYEDGVKVSEILAAPLDQVEGAREIRGALLSLAGFAKEMAASFQGGPMAGIADGPFRLMEEIEGFPVLTRSFEDGRATEETRFRSRTRQDLSEDLFSPPDGYKETQMMGPGGRRH